MERHKGLHEPPDTASSSPMPVRNTRPEPRYCWPGWDRETGDTFGKNQGNSALGLAQSSERAWKR